MNSKSILFCLISMLCVLRVEGADNQLQSELPEQLDDALNYIRDSVSTQSLSYVSCISDEILFPGKRQYYTNYIEQAEIVFPNNNSGDSPGFHAVYSGYKQERTMRIQESIDATLAMIKKLKPEFNRLFKNMLLATACYNGHLELVRALVANGATITIYCVQVALHHYDVLEYLLRNGSKNLLDQKIQGIGDQPLKKILALKLIQLYTGRRYGYLNSWIFNKHLPSVVEYLLQNGFDPNAKDDRGKTCLHYLAGLVPGSDRCDIYEIIEALVQYGADINAIDNDRNELFSMYLGDLYSTARMLVELYKKEIELYDNKSSNLSLDLYKWLNMFQSRYNMLIKELVKCTAVDKVRNVPLFICLDQFNGRIEDILTDTLSLIDEYKTNNKS